MNATPHLLVPQPPWRPAGLFGWPGVTSCSRRGDTVAVALPVAEFAALRAADLAARTLTTCGSCYWSRGEAAFAEDPVAVIGLDTASRHENRTGRRRRLTAELHAIAALIAAHPAEFESLLEGELTLAALARLGQRRSRP